MDDKKPNLQLAFLEVIKEGIFWLAILWAYFKTAELLSFFSPHNIFGFVGIESWYGYGAAIMVEGMFVVMKYRLQYDKEPVSQMFSTLMAVGALAVSFIAQGLDTVVLQGKISSLPLPMQQIFAVVVPAIPVIVVSAIAISDALTKQYSGKSADVTDLVKLMTAQFKGEGKVAQPEPDTEMFPKPIIMPGIVGSAEHKITFVNTPVKRGPGRPRKVVAPELPEEHPGTFPPPPGGGEPPTTPF